MFWWKKKIVVVDVSTIAENLPVEELKEAGYIIIYVTKPPYKSAIVYNR
jgi:hypothetical protein